MSSALLGKQQKLVPRVFMLLYKGVLILQINFLIYIKNYVSKNKLILEKNKKISVDLNVTVKDLISQDGKEKADFNILSVGINPYAKNWGTIIYFHLIIKNKSSKTNFENARFFLGPCGEKLRSNLNKKNENDKILEKVWNYLKNTYE